MPNIPLTPVKNCIEFSYCDYGIKDTTLEPCELLFNDFSAKFKEPDIGEKDGSYFLRGEASQRKDQYLKKADLIIIDADSSIDLKTCQVSDGAPDAGLIHDFLKYNNITHLLYSSYSNGAKGNRYRVVIPAELNDKDDLKRCIDYIFLMIHEAGICLHNSQENYTWAQAWYSPRIPIKHKGIYEYYHFNSGKTIDPTEINNQTGVNEIVPVSSSKAFFSRDSDMDHILATQLTDLEDVIKELPADDYHDWIKVGLAIHNETNGSDKGFNLWHQWSEKSDNYNNVEECRFKWKSFCTSSSVKKVTIGTLIYMKNKYSLSKGIGKIADHLLLTKSNEIKASIANIVKILFMDDNLPTIYYDEFLQDEIVDNQPVSDKTILKFKLYLSEQYELEIPTMNVREAILLVADFNLINSLIDYFESLTWDQTKRLDNLLIDNADAANTDYTRSVTAITFLSAVKRAYESGCKVDSMLILEGPQGCLKSTLIKVLCPDEKYYSDTPLQIGNKDAYQQLRGKFLYEISEMSSILNSRNNDAKTYLSAAVDNYRGSYGSRNADYRRRNIFIGTTNDREYLLDSTGGRRYLPIRVDNIDIASISKIKDQLWAEAIHRYKAGEKCYLSKEMEKYAIDEQSKRFSSDPWESEIDTWLEENNLEKVTSNMIWLDLFKQDISKIKRQDHNRISSVMARLEYEHKTISIDGVKVKGYIKGNR